MAIRKFIEEIGEKVLPPRRGNPFPLQQQQGQASFASPVLSELNEDSEAIRRYILSRRGFVAPSDLVVLFNEDDGVVILGGTVRDEKTRELIIGTAGNIQGVERVDDRMMGR
jgi:hypothetical protein